jgi:adenylosuccinate lyase
MQDSHDTYLSPFSWRYGSQDMRILWSEVHKRRLWRQVWVALANAQFQAGLVTRDQVDDLTAHRQNVNIARALEIESQIHHDLMAEVHAFAEQCPVGGRIIHLGATSADIEDNADVLRIRESMQLVIRSLKDILVLLAEKITEYAHTPTMAFTHLQPAEPTTVGYRFSLYAQDLLDDLQLAEYVTEHLRGKGIKGAVGTGASYQQLLTGTMISAAQFEESVMRQLDLPFYPIASQTYPRKQDWQIATVLSGIAGSLYKFAFDLRVLQSPVIGEWHEPFAAKQVGSSAMPFKRNPIHAEKMDSLGRLVESMVSVTWGNAAHSLLERTLDDSANRREVLPTIFLAVDEMLIVAKKLISGLKIDHAAIQHNFSRFAAFSATERVMMAAVSAGADRQVIHEVLRELSMTAWASTINHPINPLTELIIRHDTILQWLPEDEIRALMDASEYVGNAPQRALQLVETIRALP